MMTTGTPRPCRACGQPGLRTFLDLGALPLADALPFPGAPEDQAYPLQVALCESCSLVQILDAPPPEALFARDFPYYSSYSAAYLEHAARFAQRCIDTMGLHADSLIIEVASNDGYLLRNFAARGFKVLGFDPAAGPAAAAIAAGIATRVEFFTPQVARAMVHEGLRAELIVANNLLAHVPDPNAMLEAMAAVLKPQGVVSVEVPYVRELVERCAFDTIYHEHHCYFSLTAIDALLRRNRLRLVDVERIPVHGGSLRVTAAHEQSAVSARGGPIRMMLDQERAMGLGGFAYFRDFSARVMRTCDAVRGLLGDLKRQGKRIAAYGAAAKGAVLLNVAGVGADVVEFVVDRNPHKHGRLMPGVRIPIRPVQALLDEMPDYVLLLAWNWADEILAQQSEYARRGGRFVLPVPVPRVLAYGG